MAESVIHQTLADVKVDSVQVKIPSGSNVIRSVTAKTITGYEFVSWLGANTVGWVGYAYPSNWSATTCDFWTTNGTASNDRTINCYALYKKR